MMFRSLFFIAPLASADEQTAMLQLNRRGEVSQHTVNDALIGSLEQSLMSKDPEKLSPHSTCQYYLRTVNADVLLQKMHQLKGHDKTQQLLQRAMDSVGEENIRSLEENLMSKDDDKDKKEEVKDSEKKLSPCEVLTELRHAFKHHMDHYREVKAMTEHTADKVGQLVEEFVKKGLEAAQAVLKKDSTAIADAQKELKAINMTAHLKEIQDHQMEEKKKTVEAIKNVVPKLKGSKMGDTLEGRLPAMEEAVKKYEKIALENIDTGMKDLFSSSPSLPAPAGVGYNASDVTAVFVKIGANIANEDKAKEALNDGIEILKKYIDHVFKAEAENIWTLFADLWKDPKVLATPANFTMTAPPQEISDNLFWSQARGFLDAQQHAHVETVCKADAYPEKNPNDWIVRKICDGADLKCADEMQYLAAKTGANATAVCEKVKAKTIGKDLGNDVKLDDTKFTSISDLSFMANNDGKTCEKWESIKKACDSITA